MTVLLASAALASPGMYGAAHLGSAPIEPGTVWAGTGAAALRVPDAGVAGVGLEAGGAIGERFAFDVQAGADARVGGFPVAAAARWLLADGPRARIAVTWTSFVLPLRDGVTIDGWSSFTAHSPGIALDLGGERARFDLALPVYGLTSYDRFFGIARQPFPLYGTLGANLLLDGGHRLRFGLPELVTWSYRGDRVYFDLGGAVVYVGGAVWTKVGVSF